MRRLSLPPVGALTHVDQLRAGDALYILSPARRDPPWYWAKVRPEGIEFSDGPWPILRGILISHLRDWVEVSIPAIKLNLRCNNDDEVNDFNDVYVFRNLARAEQYLPFCENSRDKEDWHEYSDGRRRRRALDLNLAARATLNERPN